MARMPPPWDEIRADFVDASVLLGNGASRAVWSEFEYDSLHAMACSDEAEEPLSEEAQELFETLNTKNFEIVLATLRAAKTVADVLKNDGDDVKALAAEVRRGVISAVEGVHVPAVNNETRQTIADELLNYRSIYTTNYDLLLYWSFMMDQENFGDFFWQACFNPDNVEVWPPRRPVLYLHGALHLFRDEDGDTCKFAAGGGLTLLQLFDAIGERDPVFVSEGSSADKMDVIRNSAYLRFAHERLASDPGPFVVFGHALGQQDAHIAAALDRNIAIAIGFRPGTPAENTQRRAAYQNVLPHANLRFFDATTHPLGDPGLSLDP